jgi:hypothetical protein
MDWGTIAEIAIANLISGGLIVTGITLIGNHLSNKSLTKFQASLDEKNKHVEAEISKKNYISKTRFETEFSIYRELTMNFSKMVINISLLVPYGLVNVPAKEEDRKKLDQDNYIEAKKAAVEAQDSLHANKAFISKELCNKYEEILQLAVLQLEAYTRRFNLSYTPEERQGYKSEDFLRTKELQDKWDAQTDRIRDYLANLEVIS